MSTGLLAAIFAIAGIIAVIGVSYAFYLVGRSEDRDREAVRRSEDRDREAARQRPPEPEPGGDHHRPGTARERRRPLPPRRPQR